MGRVAISPFARKACARKSRRVAVQVIISFKFFSMLPRISRSRVTIAGRPPKSDRNVPNMSSTKARASSVSHNSPGL